MSRLSRIFQNMHATTGAVDKVQPAMLVRADVIRLHCLPTLDRGHVVADLRRAKWIAYVHRPQAGVEIGKKNEVFPRAIARDVFEDIMRAIAAGPVKILFAFGHESRDGD